MRLDQVRSHLTGNFSGSLLWGSPVSIGVRVWQQLRICFCEINKALVVLSVITLLFADEGGSRGFLNVINICKGS